MAQLSIFDEVRKVRILLSEVMKTETDAYIELRETTEAEQVEYFEALKSEAALSAWFKERLPNLFVEHNIEKDGAKATNKEIIEKFLTKGMLMNSIKREYTNFLQLLAPQKKEKKSDK